MVDTNSTQSIVNVGFCDPKWRIKSHPLILKTLQNNIKTATIYRISLLSELGNCNEQVDFTEYKLHHYYDGMLGNDVLQKFGDIVDYISNKLIIIDKHTYDMT